jgi:transcriptional regulator of acetoin/glycerol metabolism
MAPMDMVLNSIPDTDVLRADLEMARRRVAELETEVRRLRAETTGTSPAPFTELRLLEVEARLVRQAMERWQGNISRAARALGLSRSALYRRLERHKIAQNRASG